MSEIAETQAVQNSLTVAAMAPVLALGPVMTCGVPRIMAPLFIICSLLAIALDCWARKARPLFDKRLAMVFGAFIVYGAISYFWTVNPKDTFPKCGELIAVFGAACGLIPLIDRLNAQDFKRMGILLAIGLGLGVLLYLFETFNDFPFYAFMHGPNNHDVIDVKQNKPAVLIGLWLYLMFPFFIPRANIWQRLAFMVAVPVAIFCTLYSKSTSAQYIILAAPFGGLLAYLLPPRWTSVMTLVTTVALLIAMPFIAYNVGQHTNWRHNNGLVDSIKSRIEIWDQAARRTMEKPILGWGLDSAPMIPDRGEKSYNPEFTVHHLHPHNALLQIWEETGLIGVVMACVLFFLFFQRIRAMDDVVAQKYTIFMWACVFLYTLSIWGVWQTWFISTLTFMGLMTYAGARRITLARRTLH